MFRKALSLLLVCLMVLTLMPAFAASKCPKCGNDNVFSSVDDTAPWCTEPGVEYWVCRRCQYWEERPIAPLGHSWSTTWTVPPTCTTPGEGFRYCTRCGEQESGVFDALGHDFTWTVVEPTCTKEGTRTGVCDRCGHTWTGTTPANGHKWTEWTVVSEAAPGQLGIRERHCSVCFIEEYEYFSVYGSNVSLHKEAVNFDGVTSKHVGEAIVYEITVTNNSDVYMYDIEVIDELKGQNEDSIVGMEWLLEPHSSLSWNFTYTVTAEDTPFVYNVAMLNWAETNGEFDSRGLPEYEYFTLYSNEVYVPTVAEGQSELTLTKYLVDADAEMYYTEGEILEIGVDVVNNSDHPITLTGVYDILVHSGEVYATRDTSMILDAGMTGHYYFNYRITAEDVERGHVTDYILIDASETNRDLPAQMQFKSNELTIYCDGGDHEECEVEKYTIESPANGAYYVEGEHASFTIDFVNLSDRNIVVSRVEDVDAVTLISTVVGGSEVVYPDERVSCIFDYVVTAEDVERGYAMDYGIVYWYYEDDPEWEYYSITNDVRIDCGEYQPIVLTKKLVDETATTYQVGEYVDYMVTVANVGEATFAELQLFDEITDTGDFTLLGDITDLAPGDEFIMTFGYYITAEDVQRGSVTDRAGVVIGSDWSMPIYSNTVTVFTEGAPVQAVLEKYVVNLPSCGFFTEGDVIHYEFVFYNNSDVDLADVTVYDDYIGDSVNIGPVSAYGSGTADFYYTVSAMDCEAGSFFNMGRGVIYDTKGNVYAIFSNPVDVPLRIITDGPGVSIAVKKQAISQPLEGADGYYTPGETVIYLVTVTNTGDLPVYDLNAIDVMYIDSGILEMYDYSGTPLQPGESVSFTYMYQLTYEDCLMGTIYDCAYVVYNADNDMGGTEYSNNCWIYTKVTPPDIVSEYPVIMKYEISTPVHYYPDYYYEENETVSYMVVFYNCTDKPIADVTVYDILADTSTGIICTSPQVDPHEVIMIQVDYKVTGIDVDIFGQVTNIAWATGENTANGNYETWTSNEVTVPCGKPETPAPSHGSSCVKTLTAANNGSELVRTDLCGAHYSIELAAAGMDDPAEVAAMWKRNVILMYSALHTATGSDAVITDRDMFLAEIEVLGSLLGEEDYSTVISILRERATELCYELSGLERKDNILNPATENPLPTLTVNNCVYDVRTGSQPWYQTTATVSAGHLMTQNAVDKLLAAADDPAYTQALLEKANGLWLTALNAQYSQITRENPAFAADSALFLNSVNSRKAALSAVYPDDPALVSGLILREVKNRTIILCENAK